MKSAVGETFGFSGAIVATATPVRVEIDAERVAGAGPRRMRAAARGLPRRGRRRVALGGAGVARWPTLGARRAAPSGRGRRRSSPRAGRRRRRVPPPAVAAAATSPRRSRPRAAAAPPRRLRRRASPRPIAERVDHRARRVDERARRAARERAREVGRRGALRADAREQQDRLRQQLARLADRARVRRADDGADRDRPRSPTRSSPHSSTSTRDVLPQRPPVGERRGPGRRPPAFDVLTRQKMPAPSRRHGGDERLERVAAELRVDGQRVGDAAASPLEVRRRRRRGPSSRCRRACRRRSRAGRPRARSAHDLVERGDPVGAERLEERELRLDARRRAARPRR